MLLQVKSKEYQQKKGKTEGVCTKKGKFMLLWLAESIVTLNGIGGKAIFKRNQSKGRVLNSEIKSKHVRLME